MKRAVLYLCVALSAFLLPLQASLAYESDEAMANDITAAVGSEPELQPYSLQVDVSAGRVDLRGKVASGDRKWRIESIVRRVPGVREVRNMLTVGYVNTRYTDELDRKVCEAAMGHLDRLVLQDYNVELDCQGGTVTITGTVGNQKEIYAIGDEVLRAQGVSKVINHLRLKPEMSDTYLQEVVRETLEGKEGLSLSGLTFTVKDGVVTFNGAVARHEDIDRILSRALMIEGVKDVQSNVKVGAEAR